jgi:membrane protease YdiL (CAAX protease family)
MNHLERALDNQNQWWKYLVIIVGGFAAANIIGAIPIIIVMTLAYTKGNVTLNPDNPTNFSALGISPNFSLALLVFPFIIGLITVILLLKPLHRRSFQEVINGTGSIRWNRFFTGALIWIVMMAVYLIIFYLIDPENFQFSFNVHSFVALVIISALLLPFQTTYEELVFRGYLAQGLAAWTRSRWMALIIPALLFGLLHSFNPEVKEFGFWLTMPQYWLFGLFFGLLTILDDGIELAMGVHAANNVFTSIMVTHKSSVLQTPALFTQHKVEPLYDTLFFVLLSIVFVAILAKKYHWNFAVLNMKVKKEGAEEFKI